MIDDGFVAKLLYPEGDDDVPVGQVLAILVEDKADVEKFANYTGGSAPAEPKQEVPNQAQEENKATTTSHEGEENKATTTGHEGEENKATTTGGSDNVNREFTGKMPNLTLGQGADRVLMSPLAKRLALQNGLELSSLRGVGTGPNGRVLAENVEAVLSSGEKPMPAQTSAPAQQQAQVQAQVQVSAPQAQVGDIFEDIKLTTMRKVIASRLLESKQTIPHYYLNRECEMDNLISFRKTLNEASPVKLSVSDLIIKAIALASMDVPEANSHWMGTSIRQYNQVNVNFALSTDAGL